MLSEIDNYLVEFTGHIKQQNAAGKYDINKLAENRAAGLFNLIYGYNLENANNILQNNFPAIDLVDARNGVVIQVTATSGTDKLIYTLEKFMEKKLYNNYNQLIIYILTDKQASIYKSTEEKIQEILDGKISFDFKTNVIDNKGLGVIINGLVNINQIESVHKFLENEFKAVKDSKIKLPQDLNLFSSNTGNNFIERTSLIEEINAKFQSSNIVLIHGISGIGKTAIAKAFINASRSNYDHFAYVQIDGSFTESTINSLKYIDPTFEYNSTISPNENLIILFQNIKQIPNSLLILDGANDDDELRNYREILEGLNWNILITSRTIPDSYRENNITVKHLPEEQALDLFRVNYGKEDEIDESAVKRILLKINFHTKLIILLAKAAQNNPLLQLEELANKVYDEDYKDENINIDITIDNEENSVFQFILLLFEPNELSDEQKLYLRYFTVLPNQEISIEILVKLFEKDTRQGYFINIINKLIQKGWIEKNGTFYSIHPIVRLVIKNKISFSIDFFTPLILNSEYYLRNSTNYIENGIYISYGESIVNFFSDDRHEIGLICNRISLIYMGLHDMPRSLMYCERAIKIFELYGNSSEILAQAYGNLGVIHNINREFEKAEIWLLKALEMQRELLPETHHDIASTYSNLGGVYQRAARSSQNPEVAMRYFQASLDLYSDSLSIQEKRLTDNGEKRDAHNLAIGYNNVAMIYDDLFRRYNNPSYEKMSAEYDKKSLDLLLNYFGENYPLTARSFNNNGLTFLRSGQLNEAREYIEKGLQIRVKILPDNHHDIGNSLYNLARVMIEQGFDSKEKIKETLLSSIDIMQKSYDPNHPTLKAAQALLIEQ